MNSSSSLSKSLGLNPWVWDYIHPLRFIILVTLGTLIWGVNMLFQIALYPGDKIVYFVAISSGIVSFICYLVHNIGYSKGNLLKYLLYVTLVVLPGTLINTIVAWILNENLLWFVNFGSGMLLGLYAGGLLATFFITIDPEFGE